MEESAGDRGSGQEALYTFNHEISTGGVAVSALYSKLASPCKMGCSHQIRSQAVVIKSWRVTSCLPNAGLDPGKEIIVTVVDEDGK